MQSLAFSLFFHAILKLFHDFFMQSLSFFMIYLNCN